MVFDLSKIKGIDLSAVSSEEVTVGEGVDAEKVLVYRVSTEERTDEVSSAEFVDEGSRAFLVLRKNTLEVRTDGKLANVLRERYESVMQSRYFGRGGIEIVNSGQLSSDELCDLVRLSYDMSR